MLFPSLHSETKSLFTTMILILTFGLIAFSGLVLKQQFFSPRASYCGYLNSWVSSDGKTPKLSIDLPAGLSTQYFLHLTSGTPAVGCQTSFDASIQICDKSFCGPWSVPTAWKSYRSDAHGLAKIDIEAQPEGRVLHLKFRVSGSPTGLSNPVSLRFVKNH